jgi:hypothetical protein
VLSHDTSPVPISIARTFDAADNDALNGTAAANGPSVARTSPTKPSAPPTKNPNTACDLKAPGPDIPAVNKNPGKSTVKWATNRIKMATVVVLVLVTVLVDVVVEDVV